MVSDFYLNYPSINVPKLSSERLNLKILPIFLAINSFYLASSNSFVSFSEKYNKNTQKKQLKFASKFSLRLCNVAL